MGNARTIVGIFSQKGNARDAIRDLKALGLHTDSKIRIGFGKFGLPKNVTTEYRKELRHGATILASTAYHFNEEADIREVFTQNNAYNVHVIAKAQREKVRSFDRSLM